MADGVFNQIELRLSQHAACASPDDIPTKRQAIRVIEPDCTTATVRLLGRNCDEVPETPLDFESSNPLDDEWRDPFPVVGGRVLHFQLEEELGRGAFARVYLARQESLANRLVVLKATTVLTDEPQTMARLRHTNIVPVYSVHKSGPVQIVCMPYLGPVTLGRIINSVMTWNQAPPADAEALLAPLGAIPERHELKGRSYVEGCLWLVGQIASGLGHAHSRGVLHQDVKPANVLITEDGVPMLLDFNVASDGNRPSPGRIGGTLPYMSPEHLRQFLDEEVEVNERSDLFSLGVILYQLLAGRLPFPVLSLPDREETIRRMAAMRQVKHEPIRKYNSAATPAIEAIVRKLLEPEAADRYPSADALREDINRQLAHQPLAFAQDRSLCERASKWRRRHPRLATGVLGALTAFLTLVLPAGLFAARESRELERAEQARRTSLAHAADHTIGELETAAVELCSLTDHTVRDQGLQAAKNLIARYNLTHETWKDEPHFALLDADRQAALTSAFGEVLVLMTRADAAAGGYSREAIAAGLRWNAIAATLFEDGDRPAVLERHRLELEARQSGRAVATNPFWAHQSKSHSAGPERDADLYFDGLDLIAAGHYREALPRLTRYCDRRPAHFRAWFARGVCHDALGQAADAAAAFSVCLALMPDFPTAVANRGIARLKQRRYLEADADFTRVLELRPRWVSALLNRGIVRLEQKRFRESADDFTAALAEPAAPTRLYFLRSRARLGAGDRAGADADRNEGLAREPRDALSWATRGRWRMEKEPDQALADYAAALKLDPSLGDALLNTAIILADYRQREAEAIPVLDRLLELYPDHIEARASRGVYLARLGRLAEARRDCEQTLAAEPTASRKYQMAGLQAQLARHEPAGPARSQALRLLAQALRGGFDDLKTLNVDRDLDPIRNDPEFKRLLAAAQHFLQN